MWRRHPVSGLKFGDLRRALRNFFTSLLRQERPVYRNRAQEIPSSVGAKCSIRKGFDLCDVNHKLIERQSGDMSLLTELELSTCLAFYKHNAPHGA